jgi:hypothetical protein
MFKLGPKIHFRFELALRRGHELTVVSAYKRLVPTREEMNEAVRAEKSAVDP